MTSWHSEGRCLPKHPTGDGGKGRFFVTDQTMVGLRLHYKSNVREGEGVFAQ